MFVIVVFVFNVFRNPKGTLYSRWERGEGRGERGEGRGERGEG